MNQRDLVTMTPAEASALLASAHKLQLATLNRDGTPHLVTMFYVLVDGKIAFWTYRSSQKARNLARDPRLTCLVETGEDYFELPASAGGGGMVIPVAGAILVGCVHVDHPGTHARPGPAGRG
jgi:hypothetical protein